MDHHHHQAGRIVLPKFIRDALGLLPGTKVDISPYGAGVQVVPAGRTARLVEEDGVLYRPAIRLPMTTSSSASSTRAASDRRGRHECRRSPLGSLAPASRGSGALVGRARARAERACSGGDLLRAHQAARRRQAVRRGCRAFARRAVHNAADVERPACSDGSCHLEPPGYCGGAVYDGLVALAAKEHGVALATRDARARGTYNAVGVKVVLVA